MFNLQSLLIPEEESNLDFIYQSGLFIFKNVSSCGFRTTILLYVECKNYHCLCIVHNVHAMTSVTLSQ